MTGSLLWEPTVSKPTRSRRYIHFSRWKMENGSIIVRDGGPYVMSAEISRALNGNTVVEVYLLKDDHPGPRMGGLRLN